MLDRDRGKLCFTVKCNGIPECRAGRNLPTIDPVKVRQFLSNTGFVEMPGRGWVCPTCCRILAAEAPQAAQPGADPAVGAIVLIDTYHDRLIDVAVSKTGFDANLDGRTLMHGFKTAAEAMDAMKWFIDSWIAYQERQK